MRPTTLHSSKSQNAAVSEIPSLSSRELYLCCEDLRLEPRYVKALLVPLDVSEPGTTGSDFWEAAVMLGEAKEQKKKTQLMASVFQTLL